MGTCVPPHILGPDGYFNLKQSDINDLELITAGNCPIHLQGNRPIDLEAFVHLRSFSWTGLWSRGDLNALV